VYQTRVDESPTGKGGILDLADERNPFGDYSVVFVPPTWRRAGQGQSAHTAPSAAFLEPV